MVREASPATWLNDAQAVIAPWSMQMPGADRLKLAAAIRSDGGLDLRCDDGWGKTTGFGLYVVENGGARFYPGRPEIAPNTTLKTEQEFIAHLLLVLRSMLARVR